MPTCYPKLGRLRQKAIDSQSGLHRETVSKDKGKRNKLSAFKNM